MLNQNSQKKEQRDFYEIISSEFISITGGLVAGISLAFYTDKILLIPGLLILIPGFMEMRGNISGSLASRISSLLHIGYLKPELKKTKTLMGNIISSYLLAVTVGLVLGIVAYIATMIFFKINYPLIILVALIAVMISNVIEIPLTIYTVFWLYKKGHDPDNIMGPYITTVGDIISILSLFIAVFIAGG